MGAKGPAMYWESTNKRVKDSTESISLSLKKMVSISTFHIQFVPRLKYLKSSYGLSL